MSCINYVRDHMGFMDKWKKGPSHIIARGTKYFAASFL